MIFLKKFRKTFLVIGILYFLDVFVTGQGIIATFFATVAIIAGFVRMLWAIIRLRWEVALERLFRIILYMALIFLTVGSIQLLSRLANDKMKVVVGAVEAYKLKYDRYPDTLQELVPEFLKGIPAAKPNVLSGSFFYIAQPQQHYIRYQTNSLGNHEYYDFERKRWGYYQFDRQPPAHDYEPGITSYLDQPSRSTKSNGK